MRAIVTRAPGGFENTKLEEAADPAVRDGDVLVEIHSVGLNPADAFLIEGRYPGGPKPPFTVGRDAAGVVVQSDSNGRWKVGTKVVALQCTKTNLAEGTLSERQRIDADCLAEIPAGWSMEEAAAAPLVYQTAWRGLVVFGNAEPGKTVVITGASGGVGSAAVQLAVGLGAKVVALSRSEEKRKRLVEIGAHHVVDAGDPELKRKVMEAIGKSGANLALDTVGGPYLSTCVHVLGKGGMVAVVGVLGGVEGSIPIPSLMFKESSVKGVVVSYYEPREAQTAWTGIVNTLAKIKQKPIVDSVYPLEKYEEAFGRLRGSPFGKVVVKCKS